MRSFPAEREERGSTATCVRVVGGCEEERFKPPPPPREGPRPPRRTCPRCRPPGTASTRKPSLASWTRPQTAIVRRMSECEDTGTTHEFQFIHTFSSVPVDESLSPVHGRELLSNAFEEGLDAGWSASASDSLGNVCVRSGVADESRSHLETTRGDVTVQTSGASS